MPFTKRAISQVYLNLRKCNELVTHLVLGMLYRPPPSTDSCGGLTDSRCRSAVPHGISAASLCFPGIELNHALLTATPQMQAGNGSTEH